MASAWVSTDLRVADKAARIGAASAILLGDPSWIRRRSETGEFRSHESARVSVTVDLVIPAALLDLLTLRPEPDEHGAIADGKRRIAVPIDFLHKRPLVNFDITLEGRPITAMRSGEVREITVAMLVAVASREGEATPAPAHLELLRRIAGVDSEDAGRAHDELAKTLGATAPTLVEEAAKYVASYPLFAELTTEQPELIVKFAHDVALSGRTAAGPETASRVSWRSSVGLADTVLELRRDSYAFAASYHVEGVVPDELRIVSARVEGSGGRPPVEQFNCDRASLYPRGQQLGEEGRLVLTTRTYRSVFLGPAALIAALSAVALIAGGGLALLEVIGDSVTGSAGAAVFLAPSVASGLVLARPGSELVRTMLGNARVLLAVVTLLTIAAAAVFALGLRDMELGIVWLSLGLVGAGCAGILVVAANRAFSELARTD